MDRLRSVNSSRSVNASHVIRPFPDRRDSATDRRWTANVAVLEGDNLSYEEASYRSLAAGAEPGGIY